MNAALTLLRIKNRLLGTVAREATAKMAAKMFLTPRSFPLKEWEEQAEQQGERIQVAPGLSGLRWGEGEHKILLMHGWESRATQMYGLVKPLLDSGFQVIALDGPRHGHSQGDKANPVAFAEAIVTADKALGPFYAAVGHSMGGAAVGIALDFGVSFERCALIASPARIIDVLMGFAKFIGLPARCAERFVEIIEDDVGHPAPALDVGRILQDKTPEIMLLHARDDIEIPYAALTKITHAYPKAQTQSFEGLGHRKILRDATVALTVQRYMQQGLAN